MEGERERSGSEGGRVERERETEREREGRQAGRAREMAEGD